MAIVVTQLGNSTTFGAGSHAASISPIVAVPNGALIIVTTAINITAGNNTLTDSSNNLYVRIPSANLRLIADSANGEIWYSANSNALTTAQSITYTGGGSVGTGAITAISVTGLTNEKNYISDDLVTTANTLLTHIKNDPLIVTSNTPNAWNEFFYGVVIVFLVAQNDVSNNDPLWTNLPDIATGTKIGDIRISSAYKITNNNQSQVYRSNTSGVNEHFTSAIVSFRQKRTSIQSSWIG